MYLIRDVFRAKPGKAKNLVSIFKQAFPYTERNNEYIIVSIPEDIQKNPPCNNAWVIKIK